MSVRVRGSVEEEAMTYDDVLPQTPVNSSYEQSF